MLSSISIIFITKNARFPASYVFWNEKSPPTEVGGLLYPFLYYIILFTLLQPKLASYGGHLLQRNIY